jgi:ubiquinone/menaquinone biosynthesis C-methylase UbiE
MAKPEATTMSQRWDEFGAEDSYYHIVTRREPWDRDAFYASGRVLVDWTLDWVGDRVGRDRMLEIGCGVGRTAVHYAKHFARVDGLDVSPVMIEQANANDLPENVHLRVGTGRDLSPFDADLFDLVYSIYVFQHIPDEAAIATYLREVARVLAPAGCAALQFDTRPRTLPHRLYKMLPDVLLPRPHRRFIRRYRRDPERLRELARDAGLVVVDERAAGTAEHFLMLRRA